MKKLICIVNNNNDKFKVLEKIKSKLNSYAKKLNIKNKKLKTEILIKKNYILNL